MVQVVPDDDYMSVQEAAARLEVDQSTIRRWIASGDLPAYRVGKRRIALKRSDVAALITPARPPRELSNRGAMRERRPIEVLTADEQQQARAAVAAARRLQTELLARRDGKPFSPSWKVLDELRDERSHQQR